MKHAAVPVSSSGWSPDPADPDFQIDYRLEPGDRVRLTIVWPVRLAQHLHRPPHLALSPEAGGWRLRLTLGLTAVYRLVGDRLDPWLERLARLERLPREDQPCHSCSTGNLEPRPSSPGPGRAPLAPESEAALTLDAHTPLELTMPALPLVPPAPEPGDRGC